MSADESPLDDLTAEAPLNPVEVEAGIRKIARLIHYGIRVVSDAEAEFRRLDAAHDRARAHAFLSHKGPQTEKRYAAEVDPDVVAARDERDVAELAYRHAERRQRALIAQLDAVRSVGASVRAMYSAETGVGR